MLIVVIMLTLPVGVVLWTLTEYGAHRFLMHNVGGRGPAAHEHLMHHAQPERTRAFIRTTGHIGMYTGAVVVTWLVAQIISPSIAIGLGLGWALGYTLYESFHWLAHHRPPRGQFDLRLRRRHFHHHFRAPLTNLGVMTSFWDRLFGTEAELGVIRVPRRLAMPWLVDEQGDVLPQFRSDYEVVGTLVRSPVQDEADKTAAFADQPVSTA